MKESPVEEYRWMGASRVRAACITQAESRWVLDLARAFDVVRERCHGDMQGQSGSLGASPSAGTEQEAGWMEALRPGAVLTDVLAGWSQSEASDLDRASAAQTMLAADLDAADTEVDASSVVEAHLRRGDALRAARKFVEAEKVLASVLKNYRTQGCGSPKKIARILDALASISWELEDFSSACSYLGELRVLRVARYGSIHPKTLRVEVNLALAEERSGACGNAEHRLRRAWANQRAVLGVDHPDVWTTQGNLASLVAARGDRAEAENLYREVLAMRRRSLSAADPQLWISLNNVGVFLMESGKLTEASELLHEAVALACEHAGSRHGYTAHFSARLGACLHQSGCHEEALDLLHQAREFYHEHQDQKPKRVLELTDLMAQCYDKLERVHDAEQLREQLRCARLD